LIDLQKVQDAKHIVLRCDKDTFSHANAIYSYLLSLHKKVSLTTEDKIEKRFSFLPWFDKARMTTPSSADYQIDVDADLLEIVDFFKSHNIKLNRKMATSLYSALILEFDNFQSSRCDGITFALASELIAAGAEHQLCREMLTRREPLSRYRLRANLYANMQLQENAKCATLFISEEILDATGAELEDVYLVMDETLKLVNIESVELFCNDKNKIIKLIKDI